MHEPTTATRSGFAEPTAPEAAYLTRIAALEDHLRNETRSSQALLAENANLKALCKVLGVVPELPPDGEPIFLPLADLRDTGRTSVRHLPLSEMKVEGVGGFTDPASGQWIPCVTASGTSGGTIIDSAPVAWINGPQPRVFTRTDGKVRIMLAFESPCGQWAYHFGHTFAEAVTLRDDLTAATAKGRDFFEGVQANEQVRDASKEAK